MISLDTPQHKWASYRLGGNLLDFLELRLVLSTYDGDLRDPLWWPQEWPDPMRVCSGASRDSSPVYAGA